MLISTIRKWDWKACEKYNCPQARENIEPVQKAREAARQLGNAGNTQARDWLEKAALKLGLV